ncbi:MAG: polysulfide reductase NrfD [Coriobacteriales bacterium]|jgi:molybdopterin-containing oxidoreductase family membrane subunit|nr:polysulfide reductase NrfD [Coriobacteriales bacterium]
MLLDKTVSAAQSPVAQPAVSQQSPAAQPAASPQPATADAGKLASAPARTGLKITPTVVILAVIALAGIAAWIYQLANGLAVTGMNNGTSWGLYITAFMFFVGLSAGGLIVASSAAVFGIKQYKQVAKPAVLLSLVCIIAAAAFVLIDLGGVQRVFNLIIHANFTSPLMWDVFVITVYLILNIAYLVLMGRGSSERSLTIVSRFALPTAILVHSVTAWIFGLQIAKVGWHSAILAPLFVTSALDSGLALLLIVLVVLNATGIFSTAKKLLSNLAGLLVVCVAVDAFMVACEILTMAYPAAHEESAILALLFTGSSAPLFWGEVILGLVVPFFLLVSRRTRENTAVVVVASLLVVAGVFLKRAWLLLTAFVPFNVAGAPGVSYGRSELAQTEVWTLLGTYAPTWVEVVVSCGVVALAALIYVLLARRLFVEADGRTALTPVAPAAATAPEGA